MRDGMCYNPADLLPVVRSFPAGHDKAGQAMRWKATCTGAGCKVELIQTEADPAWLAMLTAGQRREFLSAFPKARFPVECPHHARRTMGQTRTILPRVASVAPEFGYAAGVVGNIQPMSEKEAFGES